MLALAQILTLLRSIVAERNKLALENAALRHQLSVLKRSVKRPNIKDSDRIFWIMMRRLLKDWQDALIFVKPETVIRWHREGWKHYWKRKSKPKKVGRPPISFKLIHLIRRMSKENPLWGAPHIHDELALLGHDVAESTVAKYMVHTPSLDRSRGRPFCSALACSVFSQRRVGCLSSSAHGSRGRKYGASESAATVAASHNRTAGRAREGETHGRSLQANLLAQTVLAVSFRRAGDSHIRQPSVRNHRPIARTR